MRESKNVYRVPTSKKPFNAETFNALCKQKDLYDEDLTKKMA